VISFQPILELLSEAKAEVIVEEKEIDDTEVTVSIDLSISIVILRLLFVSCIN